MISLQKRESKKTAPLMISEFVLAKICPLRYIAFTLHIRYLDDQVALAI